VRVHLDNPRQLPRLLTELGLQPDVIVTEIGYAVIEIDLLGSYGVDEMRNELRQRLELALPERGFTIDWTP
jgi:hypothetical protein